MNPMRGLTLAGVALLTLFGVSDFSGQDYVQRDLWTVYTTDTTSIASWHLTEGYQDKHGRMWFAGRDNGASLYDDGALATYNATNSEIKAQATSFVDGPQDGVWVGTAEGIAVASDRGWARLDEGDKLGLDSEYISALYLDSQGHRWVGTWGDGVRVLDGEEWTSYGLTDGLPNEYVWTFYEDSSGKIWVGTKYGVGVFDSEAGWTAYTTENSGLAANETRAFLQAESGDIWIGGYGGGVSVLKQDGEWREDPYTIETGLASNFVTALTSQTLDDEADDASELIWIGSEAGLVSFDGETFSEPMQVIAKKLSHHFIEDLHVDDEGLLWIVTFGGGVTMYDGETWDYLFPSETGLPANNVYGLLEDSAGNIWVGTSLGVAKFDGRAWETFIPDNSGLAYRYVNGLAEDRDGNIWMSTLSGGSVYSNGEWIEYDRFGGGAGEQVIPSNTLFNIFYDSQDRVWLATGLGAAVLEDGEWTLYDRGDGLNTNIISVVAEDSMGRIWLTHWQGINVLDNGIWNSIRTENADIRTDLVFASAEDSQGRMWFGTLGDGVAVYDGQRWTKFNRSSGALTNDFVRSFVEDEENGRHWVGTDGGLNGIVDDKLWMVFTAENTPLPSNRINEMLLDTNGDLWIGTEGGVAVFRTGGSDFPLLNQEGTFYPWGDATAREILPSQFVSTS